MTGMIYENVFRRSKVTIPEMMIRPYTYSCEANMKVYKKKSGGHFENF